ncbi:electron transfer flavoprotein subunit beta/FixA family protein [Ruminococcaceae bacterium OttesenSCG-928-D13]|nr:electron transfer flavoprotein subunit beta/FixA family protein [Ruminococcaceae bacterium OttesenSCG-928-D13]
MKIAVCIKQVPDTTEVRLDPKTNTLIRDGVPSIINPDDKAALEAALRIKDGAGASVTAICMGPPQADVALREALAMGCDNAILLSAREFGGSDTYATATILAAALKKGDYDLIIAGRQAIDGDTAQVGPQVAERLGIPQISYAEEIRAEADGVVVKRQYEDCYHLIEAKFPCLVTVLAEAVQPRHMTVRGTVEAYAADIPVLGFEDLKDGLNPDWIGLKGSPTNVVKSFAKQLKGQGIRLAGLSEDEAVNTIVQKLDELCII